MPNNGGGLMVPNAEEARFLRAVEARAPKRQRHRCPKSVGGSLPKAAQVPLCPKRRGPLPQDGGGLGVPQAAEALAPDRWKPLGPQSVEAHAPKRQRAPPQNG